MLQYFIALQDLPVNITLFSQVLWPTPSCIPSYILIFLTMFYFFTISGNTTVLRIYSSYWVALPKLIQGEVLSFMATWHALWYPWEACPFLKRNRGGVDLGRKNCSWDVKQINKFKSYIKQTNKQKLKYFPDCVLYL